MTGHDDTYLGNIAKQAISKKDQEQTDAQKEIFALKQEIIHLKADVKYERELRIHGADYHKPKDYHGLLREIIDRVKKETKLTDIHDIVDEAQRRLRDEEK